MPHHSLLFLLRRRQLLLLLLLLLLRPACSQPPKCDALPTEDRILCHADAARDASIRQVIAEDSTADLLPPAAPPPPDVWAAAYNQWLAPGKPGGATARAVDIAARQHRQGDDVQPDTANLGELLPEEGNDELAVISRMAARLRAASTESEAGLADVVETVEALCAGVDHGAQLAAEGGVGALLAVAERGNEAVQVEAVRALGTCAQNNAAVLGALAEVDAVGRVLQVGLEGGEAVRVAALRVLVGMTTGGGTGLQGWGGREGEVRSIVDAGLAGGEGRQGVRGKVRALALMEACLGAGWGDVFQGVRERVRRELGSGDVDVREGAARVLRAMRGETVVE